MVNSRQTNVGREEIEQNVWQKNVKNVLQRFSFMSKTQNVRQVTHVQKHFAYSEILRSAESLGTQTCKSEEETSRNKSYTHIIGIVIFPIEN